MAEKKWTLIDKKTQIASLIILIFVLIALFIVALIFLNPFIIPTILIIDFLVLVYYGGRRLEIRDENNIKNKKILDLKITILFIISFICLIFINLTNSLAYNIIFIIYFLIALDIIFLLCFIGRRFEFNTKTLKRYKILKKKLNIKIIISFFILIVLILSINYIYTYKLYIGDSIKEVKENYEKYVNQTVTFQGIYLDRIGNYLLEDNTLIQYDIFGKIDDSIYVQIDYENVDTSMLMKDHEYIFTGIFCREPWTSEFNYEGKMYTRSGNYTYLDVIKIQPVYEDINSHDTSMFIGTWKQIENQYGPYTKNWTWVINENNTLRHLEDRDDLYDHYVVDGDIFYYEYYDVSTVVPDWTNRDYINYRYSFSENDTILRLDWEDRGSYRIFQKIE